MCVACAGKHNYTDTRTPRSHWATGGNWLGYKDSNLNYLIQNQAYYRYTIPHCWSGADEEIRTLTRSPSLRPERSASASSATSAHATTSCTIHDAQGVCQSEFRGDAAPAMPVRRLCVSAIPRCGGNPRWVRGWRIRHPVCTQCHCRHPSWGRSRRIGT